MRALLHPDRSILRRLRLLLALLLVALPGCGTPALKVDLVGRVDTASGTPMSGVLVHAGSAPVTTTATDGSFEIADVTVPYTLTVASTAGDGWVHAFAGLTTATPVVVPLRFEPPLLDATITGDAWGGGPVPAGHRVAICVEGLDFVVWGCDFADAGDVTYSLQALWSGAITANVSVHASYMVIDADERPTAYAGARHLTTSVSNGGSTSVDLAPLLVIGTAPLVPITIDAGSGTVGAVVIAARISDRLVQTIYQGDWPGGTVDIRLPPAVDSYQVTAWTLFPSGLVGYAWGVADAGEALDLVVPPPPQLLAPLNDALGVTSATPFQVIDGGAVARVFDWSPTGTTPGPDVLLTTTATTATMPNVGVVGLNYAAGGAHDWNVMRVDAPDYAAAVALRVDYFGLLGVGGPGQVADGSLVVSEGRDFTLAP